MAAKKTVDEYITSLDGWQKGVVSELRELILEAAPEAEEAIKWAQPVYSYNGPLCYMRAFKKAVNFGFWRGVDLDDPQGMLQGTGEKMRHVKLTGPSEVDAQVVTGFVQQAVELNRTKGDPTRG